MTTIGPYIQSYCEVTGGYCFSRAVHNGIIENYHTLRAMLAKKGYSFYSDTDTEVQGVPRS